MNQTPAQRRQLHAFIERRRFQSDAHRSVDWCRDVAPNLVGAIAITPIVAAAVAVVLLIASAALGWLT